MPKQPASKPFSMEHLRSTAERCKNWGRWGPEDEAGTLNFVTAKDIVAAAGLIRSGRVFSLALNFDQHGPQRGLWGKRFNPVHTMLATGTDAISGNQDAGGLRFADDMISLPLQCGTQWDALGHIFFDDRMWNGYSASLVDSNGARKNSIDRVKDRMVGRGVLLDVARSLGSDPMADGRAIFVRDLEETARKQAVEIRRGDFLVIRTGQLEHHLASGEWGGYAGGEAPGLSFETCEWIRDKEIAAICMDTWGCEVRPNETDKASQPWHWVVIPMIGLSMGEIFYLKDLADDCAGDHRYEFFFCAPPLPITGAVGSPVNPIAIK